MRYRLVATVLEAETQAEVGLSTDRIYSSPPDDEEVKEFLELAQEWFTEALGQRGLDVGDHCIEFKKQHELLQ